MFRPLAAACVVAIASTACFSPSSPEDETLGNQSAPVGAELDVFLRTTERGLLLTAEGAGGGAVHADRVYPRSWESFRLILADGDRFESGAHVFIQTASGEHYLKALEGGGGALNADSKNRGPWETFELVRAAGPGLIGHGDAIGLRSIDGHFVVAEGGGGGEVNANRDGMGPWETFQVLLHAPDANDVLPSDVHLTLAPVGPAIFGTITGYEMNSHCSFSDERCERPLYKTYDRDTPEFWDALVDELLQSRVNVVMAHGRGCFDPNSGDAGNGNMCPRLLRHLVEAIDRAGARDAIRLGMWDDTGAYPGTRNIVEGRPESELFDLADPSARRFFWDHNMRVWFDTVPRELWFRVDGHPVVAFWSLAGAFFKNQKGNARPLLDELRNKFIERYGEEPRFILDETWFQEDPTITTTQAWGRNAWFGPPLNNFTMTSYNGAKWGAGVPGFRDPNNLPGCGAACREVPRADGNALRNYLSAAQSGRFNLLEGWTDVAESAGYYRSNQWRFPNQYLEIVREFSDRTTDTLRLQAESADAFDDHSGGNAGGAYRDGDADLGRMDGGWFWGWTEPGESFTFKEVKLACGAYRISAQVRGGGGQLTFTADGASETSAAFGKSDAFHPVNLGVIEVPEGKFDLRVRVDSGSPDVDWVFLRKLRGCN